MSAFSGKVFWDHPPSENIVYLNGRIDNRAEIAPNLSDSELVGLAYQRMGEKCAHSFIGDFAIAIWDAQNRRLFLARDPLGIKPLYYSSAPDSFLFASEIDAFFADPSFEQKINDRMVIQYLAGEFFDPGETFYTSIRQVPPAHYLIAEPGKAPRLVRYWDFQPQDLSHLKSREDYWNVFHTLFKQAVHDRLQSASPVGILLSGGLDSTQIAAMAETLRQSDASLPSLKPVCLLVEGFLQEEKISLDKLRERYGTEIEFVEHGRPDSRLSTFELFLETGSTPHLDGYLTTPPLLEHMQAQGCGVVLSGFGANELSNPFEFGHLEDLLLSFQWKQLNYELNRFAQAIHTTPSSLFQTVLSHAFIDYAPDFCRRGLRLLRRQQSSWMQEKFKALWSIRPAPRPAKFPHWAENKTWRALTEPLAGYGLTQMDQMAGRFSMEVRFPFLDIRLVEFFLSIPAPIKIEGGYRKSFVQNALRDIVPMPVRTEDDEACFIPSWNRSERVQLEIQRLRHYLLQPEAPVYEYVRREALEQMLSAAAKSERADLPFLWRIARLNAWLGNSIFLSDSSKLSRYTAFNL